MVSSWHRLFSKAKIALFLAFAALEPSAAAQAQGGTPSSSSVTVDLSVIEQGGSGSPLRLSTTSRGPQMPSPDMVPQSQLHEPTPGSLPYATLTPRRQRPVTLRPPGSKRPTPGIRPLELTEFAPAPRPQSESTSIGQAPRAMTAPSRTGALLGPHASPTQPLGLDERIPPPPERSPTESVEAVAAIQPEPASDSPMPPPLAPLSENASALLGEQDVAGTSEPTASVQPQIAPLSTPEAEAEAVTAPAAQTDEQTVALQPAARNEQAPFPPPAASFATEQLLQVEFPATDTDLTGSARAELKDLANRLRSQEELRLQLLAYADGEGLSPSKARRMSLSRALSVRSYLIENGIKTSRIDVRALGNKATSGALDRVDVKVVQR